MSYYYNRKYQFSHHALTRIKSRLQLNYLSDLEVINHCLELIALSHDIIETKTWKYVKINEKNLYFVIKKSDNLVLTLSPIKPEKLLEVLENNL
ncbi:MAG: hypothetical protein ACRC8P_00705 [Spiroplasma sp.]